MPDTSSPNWCWHCREHHPDVSMVRICEAKAQRQQREQESAA